MKRTLRFQRKYLCIPYVVFLVLFIVLPIVLIIFYAFTDNKGFFSFDALVDFFTTPTKISILLNSVFIALQTTIICLIISYPLAYFLANKKFNRNGVLITLFIMPMWINFVLRTGATRDLLTWLGINGGKVPYLATLIGMVYNYLPFTVLPLYTTMLKLDRSQIEAASDLGATPFQVFLRNIIPQSLPGVVSAATMVFMPTMSSYVISDTLSEGKITLFGNSIYISFSNSQWNTGSFLALIMLIIIFLSMLVTHRFSREPEARGGTW
ncbi:MAG: ABC transporter permease [Bacilli bacterium]|nr:ABC transporter permease [Bacilli bacterium]